MTMFDARSDGLTRQIRVVDARADSAAFRALPSPASVFRSNASLDETSSQSAETDAADDYERGYANGVRSAQSSHENERARLLALVTAAQALQSEPSELGELSEQSKQSEELGMMIAHTVGALVRKIVGAAAIDGDMLMADAKACAALIAETDAARTLWLHPDDIALIGSAAIDLVMMPDPAAARGSLRLDCSAGWIEAGRAHKLADLRRLLGIAEDGA